MAMLINIELPAYFFAVVFNPSRLPLAQSKRKLLAALEHSGVAVSVNSTHPAHSVYFNCYHSIIPPSTPLSSSGLAWPYAVPAPLDRKSTRLNSSHVAISYAVLCLKKKKRQT